jgi:hypothetical protein
MPKPISQNGKINGTASAKTINASAISDSISDSM